MPETRPSSAVPVPDADEAVAVPGRPGRKRDHSRDLSILAATLDVLAETGYDGMTVDVVASRAKVSKGLVYRRWPTKECLVLAAIASLGDPLEQDGLPDTGRLRSDLFSLVDSSWLGGAGRRIEVLAGLSTVLVQSAELADAVNARITRPYVAAYEQLLRRAVARGEIPPDADVDTLSQIIPAMSTHRLRFTEQPLDGAFYRSIIDGILLPAVGLVGRP